MQDQRPVPWLAWLVVAALGAGVFALTLRPDVARRLMGGR